MSPKTKISTPKWSEATVEAVKKSVKNELEGFKDPKEFYDYTLNQINGLDDDCFKDGQLRRLIYIIYTLFFFGRHGGMHLPDIRRLFQMGLAILKTQGFFLWRVG